MILNYEDRKKEMGRRIRAMRKAKKLTQVELLQALYLSTSSTGSVRKWETGEIMPELDTLARMADVFGCDIGYLLCDYNDVNRGIADICSSTGFSSYAAHVIQNLDLVVGNDRFAQLEKGTLSKRHILSQIIADDRIKQILVNAKQAKMIKHRQQTEVDLDADSVDFSNAVITLNEMNMVTLRGEDAVNFYIQDAVRTFSDILHSMVDSVSTDETYSGEIVDLDSKTTIKTMQYI